MKSGVLRGVHGARRFVSAIRASRNINIDPSARQLHSSTTFRATALPITAAGPPPSAPRPAASHYGERFERKRRQAEMLKQGKELRAAQMDGKSPLKKRFWKEVHVKETPDGYQIHLDSRPVRTPSKTPLTIPLSKPHLAHAIALEWDLLISAQQALKNFHIPLTSMTSRAQDIAEEEANGGSKIRSDIIRTLMRYLETDTLLCWAPEHSLHDAQQVEQSDQRIESLRSIQARVARPIISHLSTNIWPGIEIKPVLDETSILPSQQSEVTQSIIKGWISGLPAYELAALERGGLASKSFLVAARLLVEWSEGYREIQRSGEQRFGIEEAAHAATLEVKYQTDMWGEVEDTHDVDNEDIRRQLGSVILIVGGQR